MPLNKETKLNTFFFFFFFFFFKYRKLFLDKVKLFLRKENIGITHLQYWTKKKAVKKKKLNTFLDDDF